MNPRTAIAHGDAMPPDSQPKSIFQALTQAVEDYPDGRFIHIDVNGAAVFRSYAETLHRARCLLAGLRRDGFQPGDPVILHLERCEDFVTAVWATLLGGGITVPLVRRDWSRYDIHAVEEILPRLRDVLKSPWILTDSGYRAPKVLEFSALAIASPVQLTPMDGLDETRLLVLTSGTTRHRRLVALSERALLSRWWPSLPAKDQAFTFLSSSPFDHVMGMGIASPNLPQKASLSPDRFAASPTAWLDAVEEFSVTHATMTSSGMALVEREAARVGRNWDLRSLRKLGVGAEPVSPRACKRFVAALAPFGLRSDAIILGYGLSECGPVVGGAAPFRSDDDLSTFAALDRPTPGHSVRIVGPDDLVVSEGEVGAVQVRGPTMSLGYYADAEATRALFTPDGWIRTGDLGILCDERLTITGREKEQIIIQARKYACAEIEAVAEGVVGVESAYAVACSDRRLGQSERGHFALFIVTVLGTSPRELTARVREAVAARFGLTPTAVVPIAADAVPRTPNGKVRRLALTTQLEAGLFDETVASPSDRKVTPKASRNDRELAIGALWRDILGFEGFDIHDDFFEVGGDSIAAIRLMLAMEAAFDTPVPPEVMRERTTIARLAASLEGGQPTSHIASELPVYPTLWPLPRDLHQRLIALLETWPGERPTESRMVLGHQTAGSKPPVFWVFSGATEPGWFARALGPDQPLYVFRSGAGISDYSENDIQAFALRYMAEIEEICPDGPFFLGGYCQGGIIALAIAQHALRRKRHVPLLVLMDWAFELHPYAGRVLFISDKNEVYRNPTRRFTRPQLAWHRAFADFSFVEIEGCYAVDETALQELGAILEHRLKSTLHAPTSILPQGAYRAAIFADGVPTRMEPGQSYMIKVSLRNESDITWASTLDSGLMLGVRWTDADGHEIEVPTARSTLPKVEQGSTAVIDVTIAAPRETGDFKVHFDVCEEGNKWFHSDPKTACTASVQIDRSVLPQHSWGSSQRYSFDHKSKTLNLLVVGWSTPENWGTWSLGPHAKLRLPLSGRTGVWRIVISGMVFGRPDSMAPVHVRVGQESDSLEWVLPANVVVQNEIELDCRGTDITLRLSLPKAISPRELGLGPDSRKLGFGLVSLDIERKPLTSFIKKIFPLNHLKKP
jgi:acyl-CoA synthetase (AMP-forming)/AMP-acid ligase II/acyl carrier protein